jgi:hypothetical protein
MVVVPISVTRNDLIKRLELNLTSQLNEGKRFCDWLSNC